MNYFLMEFCIVLRIFIMFFDFMIKLYNTQMDLIEVLDQQQLLIYKKHQKYYNLNQQHNLINLNRYTLTQFQQAFDFQLCLIIRDVIISYYIESIVIIIDVNTNPFQNTDNFSEELLNYFKIGQLNFYGRIHKLYILLEMYQEIFYPFLKLRKLSFYKRQILQKQIDPKYLEQKFQGYSQNLQNNFWPPKNPKYNHLLQTQIDDNQYKSNHILSNYKNETIQSSQFTLKVYNEDNQMIFSDEDSLKGNHEYCPDLILFPENSVQISMECVLQQLTSSQFSEIKGFSNVQNDLDSQRFLQQHVNSEQQTYNVNIKPNCNMENCQLI